jgi:hypothetical protein
MEKRRGERSADQRSRRPDVQRPGAVDGPRRHPGPASAAAGGSAAMTAAFAPCRPHDWQAAPDLFSHNASAPHRRQRFRGDTCARQPAQARIRRVRGAFLRSGARHIGQCLPPLRSLDSALPRFRGWCRGGSSSGSGACIIGPRSRARSTSVPPGGGISPAPSSRASSAAVIGSAVERSASRRTRLRLRGRGRTPRTSARRR